MTDPYYWNSESAGEIPVHSFYGLDIQSACQPANLEPIFPNPEISHLTLDEINSAFPMPYATDFKHSSTSPNSIKSLSPDMESYSPTQSDARGLTFDDSHCSPQENGQKMVKRRIQNRAAQRRFRERRDEQNKNLQEKASELQTEYEKLESRLRAKTEEAGQLRGDNETLKVEIENLRQRWRTMVLLLQRPKSLQFLSVLVAGEDAGTLGNEKDKGVDAKLEDLDGYLRCMDALILPEKEVA